jgi:hypothetical protein
VDGTITTPGAALSDDDEDTDDVASSSGGAGGWLAKLLPLMLMPSLGLGAWFFPVVEKAATNFLTMSMGPKVGLVLALLVRILSGLFVL